MTQQPKITRATQRNNAQSPREAPEIAERHDQTEEGKCEFTWGSRDGAAFEDALEVAYAEVVKWRRNIFRVPSGTVGKDFIREISRLLDSFT